MYISLLLGMKKRGPRRRHQDLKVCGQTPFCFLVVPKKVIQFFLSLYAVVWAGKAVKCSVKPVRSQICSTLCHFFCTLTTALSQHLSLPLSVSVRVCILGSAVPRRVTAVRLPQGFSGHG